MGSEGWARSSWIGGHGMLPYEQKMQQSPAFGLSIILDSEYNRLILSQPPARDV
jgi:hypothetical protein